MPHTSQPELELYLLGSPRVGSYGRAIDIARRQVRALLYVLGADLEPLPREQLCFLLWPDTPDATARRNLTHLLTHLRRSLHTPLLVTSSDDRVQLAADRVCSDSAALLAFARETHAPTRFDDTQLAAAQTIAASYRGPFLDGFSLPDCPEFELWLLAKQQACERACLRLLGCLVETHAARGELAQAIVWAQQHLQVDPLAEEVHRRLIGLYVEVGERSAALRQYERCAAVLERELGVQPLPATRAAYEAALQRQPVHLLPRHAAAPRSPPTRPAAAPPLVGRSSVLRDLDAAAGACIAGTGGVVIISGAAGIGKSRLLASFAERGPPAALLLRGGPGRHRAPSLSHDDPAPARCARGHARGNAAVRRSRSVLARRAHAAPTRGAQPPPRPRPTPALRTCRGPYTPDRGRLPGHHLYRRSRPARDPLPG